MEAQAMSKILAFIETFRKDEDGAALVEYTVLLGILLIAVITLIIGVGTWINGKWAALNTALPAN
jgi:pilus assembly protein Flp/PilA